MNHQRQSRKFINITFNFVRTPMNCITMLFRVKSFLLPLNLCEPGLIVEIITIATFFQIFLDLFRNTVLIGNKFGGGSHMVNERRVITDICPIK